MINLTQNKKTIVDMDIYHKLSKFKWYAVKKSKTYYAYAHPNNNEDPIAMHRLILGVPKGKIVDHRDHNGLNNQISNLRICSHSENKANTKNYINNTSGYKGVIWDKDRNKWAARIKFMGKLINLGRFELKENAIMEYRKKAKELFGNFAFQQSLQQGGI